MMTFLVRSGFPENRLLDYPYDKIRLIYKYTREEEANDQLLQMDAMRSAFASVMGNAESHEAYSELRDRLQTAAGFPQKQAGPRTRRRQKNDANIHKLLLFGFASPM